jgi:hypothetical protein
MSQTPKNKWPVLKIRNKNPGTVSTGANTVVELDGKKLGNVKFLKLEFHSRRVTKVTMELLVDSDVEIDAMDPTITIKKVQGFQNILGDLFQKFFK